MGTQLVSYYEKAKAVGGFKAQMRMSLITKITIKEAASEPDSPENLGLFTQALKEIEKEFSGR